MTPKKITCKTVVFLYILDKVLKNGPQTGLILLQGFLTLPFGERGCFIELPGSGGESRDRRGFTLYSSGGQSQRGEIGTV
jgi:hypothetical protein